ncbi:DinB family protein [Peribacillus kribbensis]|uniref:DinB family protein n=1 Tax=Peribacillus kribbensis TaxID=356658 RepID=UPI0004072D0E|nr:DinB family protein [Peribacillus kribbensis]
MNFSLSEAAEVLERTPGTLERLLSGLSAGWLESNEGEDTWNAREVVNHLIEAEKTNWLPRLNCILAEGVKKAFPPFDRFSHLRNRDEREMKQILDEFTLIRQQNIQTLLDLERQGLDLEKTGIHPEFGTVKARELLSAWVVHDLTHISQIVRIMAERYRENTGPWVKYLSILRRKS